MSNRKDTNEHMNMSVRAYDCILKVVRTTAFVFDHPNYMGYEKRVLH